MITAAKSSRLHRFATGGCAVLVGLLHLSCERKPDGAAPSRSTGNEVKAVIPPAAQAKPPAEFSQRLRDAIAESRTRSELTAKVEELCGSLEKQHLVGLFEEAAAGPPPGVSASSWRLALNQVMEYARRHPRCDAAAPLFRLAANASAPAVIRDYASQHYLLAESDALDALRASGDDKGGISRLTGVLENAGALVSDATAESGSLPGTTLMGLAALSARCEKHPEALALIRRKVATLVMPVLEARNAQSVSTRVSAIQAAGRLRIEEAGPIIAGIAMDQKAGTRERLSAIACLRYFPGLVGISQLESLGGQNEKLGLATRSLIEELKRN